MAELPESASMGLEKVIESFCDLLRIRLERDVFTTEDSIRYTFFAALLGVGGLRPEEIVLEYRHPAIARAEVDTWIPSFSGRSLAIEFKYDRPLPGGKNTPRTQRAGHVFNDIRRLAPLATQLGSRCLIVYVATREMSSYFSNQENGLHFFFDLELTSTLTIDDGFFARKAVSFVTAARGPFNVCVVARAAAQLPKDHTVRIYEILAAASPPQPISVATNSERP